MILFKEMTLNIPNSYLGDPMGSVRSRTIQKDRVPSEQLFESSDVRSKVAHQSKGHGAF